MRKRRGCFLKKAPPAPPQKLADKGLSKEVRSALTDSRRKRSACFCCRERVGTTKTPRAKKNDNSRLSFIALAPPIYPLTNKSVLLFFCECFLEGVRGNCNISLAKYFRSNGTLRCFSLTKKVPPAFS